VNQHRITLSRIFLWFEDDFGSWKGIQEWIPQYVCDEQVGAKIRQGQITSVRYFVYDWSINRAPT